MGVDLSGFLPVPGFGGYLVDARGSVYSRYWRRVLRQHTFNSGYQYVSAAPDGFKSRNVLVHRLVALAFLGLPGYDCNAVVVNHIDGNKLNNAATNLEWCSQSHNVREAVKRGFGVGERNGASKLSEPEVRQIRFKYASGDYTQRELAKEFGISPTLCGMIVRRQVWRHVRDISGKGGSCGS